jgi:hypothetical protein
MTTVDQFLKALALVESKDNPEAWGDGGQAMGRWQVHPARLWQELVLNNQHPTLDDTWDQVVARVLRNIFMRFYPMREPAAIAMYWHRGHWCESTDPEWDLKYAARFGAALLCAEEEMP